MQSDTATEPLRLTAAIATFRQCTQSPYSGLPSRARGGGAIGSALLFADQEGKIHKAQIWPKFSNLTQQSDWKSL